MLPVNVGKALQVLEVMGQYELNLSSDLEYRTPISDIVNQTNTHKNMIQKR